MKSYMVLDLSNLCEMESDIAYLIWDEHLACGKSNNHIFKKIKVAPMRFITVALDNEEPIHVLYRSPQTGAYSISPVTCPEGGMFDLYRFLQNKKIKIELLDYQIWKTKKYAFQQYIEEVRLYDNVVVVYFGGDFARMRPISNGKLDGIDIYLKKMSGVWVNEYAAQKILDKCITGEPLGTVDFDEVLEVRKGYVEFEFNELHFEVFEDLVIVDKLIYGPDNPTEKMSFKFKKERIPYLPIFLDDILRAEVDNRLISRLADYFTN